MSFNNLSTTTVNDKKYYYHSGFGITTRYELDGPGIEFLGGGEIFRTRPDRLWGTPSLLYNEYRVSFPGVKGAGAWR